ncbi:Hypothetical predicted protein [Cloeon dipterum]|uniref:WD repeat-containing protein 55 homolog n=1 Tax=Cloeon dipterum TaxID=197152 RepID=A0A8S1DC17_9INSE|nr:Hypothetical predicted protein [Cloeon dipterum]
MNLSDPAVERQLQGHKSKITCITFNPRYPAIASGDLGNNILVWNPKKWGNSLKFEGHKGCINDLNFSPTVNLLASASSDRMVRLWVPTYSGGFSEFMAHSSGVRSVHFSPDGELLATASEDKLVKLWQTDGKRRFISSMSHHTNWVRCARFSPNGLLIGSCSDDNSAIIWDFRDEKKSVEVVQGMDSAPHHLAFSPVRETTFALAYPTGHVRVFDIRMPQELLQSYKAHDKAVHQLSFHPSGNYILSAHDDGQIKMLDLLEGRPIYTMSLHKGAATCVAFSPSGKLFASAGADRQVVIWKIGNEEKPVVSPLASGTGWKKPTDTNSKTSTKTVEKRASSPDMSRIKDLEARVKKLELLLQVSPRCSQGDIENVNPLSPGDLENRVACLEERLSFDDSIEAGYD